MLEEEKMTCAYIAGALDGDGSFSLIKVKAKKNPLYFPALQLANRSKEMAYLLKNKLGGDVTQTTRQRKSDKANYSTLFRWILRGSDKCKEPLKNILDFLILKKDQAEILLNFIACHPFIRGKTMSQDEVISRESFRLKILELNNFREGLNASISQATNALSSDPIVWSYLAGLFDTDGCFCIRKQLKSYGYQKSVSARYAPNIQLYMTSPKCINFLRKNVPFGKVNISKNKSTTMGFHYAWSIFSKNDATHFLQKIIPYLRVKPERAKILLDFCKYFGATKYCKGGVSPQENEFRENCYLKLRELNKYGVSKPSLIDLEAGHGDKGEAEMHAERLNEMAPKGDAIV